MGGGRGELLCGGGSCEMGLMYDVVKTSDSDEFRCSPVTGSGSEVCCALTI